MTHPKVSVIVAIYNMERVMRRCVESLLAQTLQDFELLLIDDGSTDGSAAICDEYAARDSRVRAIHKNNEGVASARQCGIDHAQGEYTIHADPDDWVEPDMLKQLYAKAIEMGADMVVCDYYINDDVYVRQQPRSLQPQAMLYELFQQLHGSCWNKLVSRACSNRFDIKFPAGINFCEDQYVIAALLCHDIKVSYCPVAFYHYMYNATSLSRKYDEHTYQMDLHIREMFRELLEGFPEAQQLAVESKTYSIVSRAFTFGQSYFTNATFRREFQGYAPMVRLRTGEEPVKRWLIYLSCQGVFRPANWMYWQLFRTKQVWKRIAHRIRK